MPDSPKSLEGPNSPSNRIPPPEHETPDMLARALRWRTIWPQVIALAWADEAFKTDLRANAREAIKKKFDYDLSPELDLIIEVATTGNYDPSIPLGKDRWAGLPHMVLKLYIPPAPDLKDQAIAITHYCETGRTYPMTSGG